MKREDRNSKYFMCSVCVMSSLSPRKDSFLSICHSLPIDCRVGDDVFPSSIQFFFYFHSNSSHFTDNTQFPIFISSIFYYILKLIFIEVCLMYDCRSAGSYVCTPPLVDTAAV